jgi:hypothetical protein
MKKLCIVLFDCHGTQILQRLENYNKFYEIYDLKYIPIYDYLEKDFNDEIKELFKKCDIMICQYIKNDRKYIHHEIIKTYLNQDCIHILLPHYVFSGYYPEYKLPDDFNIKNSYNKLLNIWNDIDIGEDNIKKPFNDSIKELEELEENCTIKMLEFVKENYNINRLFFSRSYPTYIFFDELTKKILNFINIDIKDYKDVYNQFGINTWIPILPCVKKSLNLNFDCFNLKYTRNERFDSIIYLIACQELKRNEINLFKKDGLNKLKFYKNLIKY